MINQQQHDEIAARIEAATTTNDERSAVEVFRFCRDKPDHAFVYLASNNLTVTTWTGERLGDVWHLGKIHRDNFGGTRQAIRVRAVNGCFYHGWHFPSAGTYARLRKAR